MIALCKEYEVQAFRKSFHFKQLLQEEKQMVETRFLLLC